MDDEVWVERARVRWIIPLSRSCATPWESHTAKATVYANILQMATISALETKLSRFR